MNGQFSIAKMGNFPINDTIGTCRTVPPSYKLLHKPY